jgi:hypothetical protein
MGQISEKAKTSTFIHNELYYKNANPDEKWVRLEDAQQEIAKVEEAALKAYCSMGEQKVIEETAKKCYEIMLKTELERERGEQKQKLQQMLKLWDNQGHLGIVLQETDWLLGEFGQLRKLELLKE